MDKSLHDTEEAATALIDRVALLERRLDSALSMSRGITFREYRLLRALEKTDGGLTRVALARRLMLTPSGVTRALKPLEKLGYVRTVRHERDARQSLATLAPGGAQLLADVQPVLRDHWQQLAAQGIEETLQATMAALPEGPPAF